MRKPSIVRTLAALSVAAVFMSAPLAGQDVPTVAVMDFSSFMMGEGGASVDLGKAISAMLVTEFSGREGMRIVERAQLRELLREQDLSLSGRIEEADAIEVGKMLGVQYVLHGQVTSIVDNLRMDIRAVDVETSEIVSVMKKSDKTTELFAVVVALADEFGDALDLTRPSERPQVESIPVRATIEFSRAVSYEDNGETELAIQHYEATLEIHPTHRDAQRALERLRGGT
jgi:curli biogenesis system outer membrane secretion channel CsgG